MLTTLAQHTMASLMARFPGQSVVPQPSPGGAPSQLTNLVGTLLNLVAWAGTAAGVAGILITGAMMGISMKRGESSEHLSRLGMVLCGCILVATAGPIVSLFFGGGTGNGNGNN
jgi:hypothetical protein